MSLDNRTRPQVEPHIRSLDRQILDALLRIEELLINKQAPAFIVQPELPVSEDAPKPKRRFGK